MERGDRLVQRDYPIRLRQNLSGETLPRLKDVSEEAEAGDQDCIADQLVHRPVLGRHRTKFQCAELIIFLKRRSMAEVAYDMSHFRETRIYFKLTRNFFKITRH